VYGLHNCDIPSGARHRRRARVSTVAPTLKRLTGLDHLYQFLWKHLIRNGAIRDKVVRTARWALRHRRHIRFVLREVLLAMDAVYYLERLVEIAEQSYEVVRRRTILDRSVAATIKRRVRARLKVARMMTKLSLPDRAAPAVVTPSTPIAAAPSAAKGAFERVDDSE